MAKRGRPRKHGVKRTKSGQISRANSAYQEHEEPIRIRMRRLGLTEKDARDQKASTVHGLMYLRKQIDAAQYDAAEAMFGLRQSYLKAIKAPDALARGEGAGMDAPETDTHIEWAARVIAEYRAAENAVMVAQDSHRDRSLWSALDYLLFRNEPHRHMEGDFSVVLRVLAVQFNLAVDGPSRGLTKNGKSPHAAHDIPRSE